MSTQVSFQKDVLAPFPIMLTTLIKIKSLSRVVYFHGSLYSLSIYQLNCKDGSYLATMRSLQRVVFSLQYLQIHLAWRLWFFILRLVNPKPPSVKGILIFCHFRECSPLLSKDWTKLLGSTLVYVYPLWRYVYLPIPLVFCQPFQQ